MSEWSTIIDGMATTSAPRDTSSSLPDGSLAATPHVVTSSDDPAALGVRHIVWDWNGTLFDDFPLVVEATDESLRTLGLPGVTAASYRRHYCRPLTEFYTRIVGRPLDEREWHAVDAAFHALYEARMRECGLAADALSALTAWPVAGRSQSLLSMWSHAKLIAFTAELGVVDHFTRIDGNVNGDEGSKRDSLLRHLAALRASGIALRPRQVALIGDSLDDAHAAAAVGARCVLVATGNLVATPAHPDAGGVPVVEDITAAVRLLDVT
jgi:phosphoglycolate phosphatase-like HAD superfamily hydrolase